MQPQKPPKTCQSKKLYRLVKVEQKLTYLGKEVSNPKIDDVKFGFNRSDLPAIFAEKTAFFGIENFEKSLYGKGVCSTTKKFP